MSMTVVAAINVAAKIRGFLSSVMLEIAPGIYTSPIINAGVRDRLWSVVEDWYEEQEEGYIVMTWYHPEADAKQYIRSLGTPRKDIVNIDGVLLVYSAGKSRATK